MNKSSNRIKQIEKYIDDHITEDLSLTFLSKKFKMNKYYLCHCFKESSGYPLMRYIKNKRLFLAQSYCESGMNLLEASMEAGFKNYSSFYNAWQSEFGEAQARVFNQWV